MTIGAEPHPRPTNTHIHAQERGDHEKERTGNPNISCSNLRSTLAKAWSCVSDTSDKKMCGADVREPWIAEQSPG